MGREVRRVPADWEHPKDYQGNLQPMFDEPFNSAMQGWIESSKQWLRGEYLGQSDGKDGNPTYEAFAEWHGAPPDPAYYRPDWQTAPTHYQWYENVSEGTPLSPPFANKAQLVDFIVENGDPVHGPITRGQAEKFVEDKWAPSMIITGGEVIGGIQATDL